jgi:hypothetical protein
MKSSGRYALAVRRHYIINLLSDADFIFICSSLLCARYLASDVLIDFISVIWMDFRRAEDGTDQRTIWTEFGTMVTIRGTRIRKMKTPTAKKTYGSLSSQRNYQNGRCYQKAWCRNTVTRPRRASRSAPQPLLSPIHSLNGRPRGILCPWLMTAPLLRFGSLRRGSENDLARRKWHPGEMLDADGSTLPRPYPQRTRSSICG